MVLDSNRRTGTCGRRPRRSHGSDRGENAAWRSMPTAAQARPPQSAEAIARQLELLVRRGSCVDRMDACSLGLLRRFRRAPGRPSSGHARGRAHVRADDLREGGTPAVASVTALHDGRDPPGAQPGVTTAGPRVHGHPIRILVVDDEPDNAEVLGVVLSWEGFVVITAQSGEEALAKVGANPPSLILLDVMMPGIDGYATARRIKDDPSTSQIPIILFTALAERDARTQASISGANEVLSKPVDRAQLVLRVKTLLRATYADYSEPPPTSRVQ